MPLDFTDLQSHVTASSAELSLVDQEVPVAGFVVAVDPPSDGFVGDDVRSAHVVAVSIVRERETASDVVGVSVGVDER